MVHPEDPSAAHSEAGPRGPSPGDRRPTYEEILDNVADGVYFVDRDRRITSWNRAAVEITGHQAGSVIGHRCPDGPLQHVDAEGRRLCHTACPLAAVLASGEPSRADVFVHHRDGHRLPVRVAVRPIRSSTGEVTGAVETFTDISALRAVERRASEMERLAYADPLTGLGNRRFGEQQLVACMEGLRLQGHPFGVLLLDIDRFKGVNDTWGHDTGDAVLKAVGRTLAVAVRAQDVIARWGGEEFLVLAHTADARELRALGERIRRMVAASTVSHAGVEIGVTVSAGGLVAPPSEDAPQLLRRADALLLSSKAKGRDRVTIEA